MSTPSSTLPSPETAPAPSRTGWWEDAKFGLFIHWGPVSVAGTEIGWSRDAERRGYWQGGGSVPPERYDRLFLEFNPVRFDPHEWVSIAKDAGMGYVVLTTRHHDGFSLWDTSANDHKITSPRSPWRHDIVRMLADATREGGLRFGAYYSQPDWTHPDAFTDRHAAYKAYLLAQVRELMSRYGRIDILWFDGLGRSAEDYGAEEIHRAARELQPHLLINNRNGLPEDFDTPEQRVGTMQLDRPWESCITLCTQWSWKPEDTMKSLDECLRILVATVTGGGNLLLNVGPMPDGRIEPRQAERLREIGSWLRAHAEAIQGTRGGPFRSGSWGGSTHRGCTVFVHLLQPPVGGTLRLPRLPVEVTGASMFGTREPVAFKLAQDALTLEIGTRFSEPVTIVRLELAAPVPAGLCIGRAGGAFEDERLYGRAVPDAIVSASSGSPASSGDGAWLVRTARERAPSLTFDLLRVRDVTAFTAASIEHNAFDSNAQLHIDLSEDGVSWEEVYQGSYGLPAWEVPITRLQAGIQHPGRAARFVRVRTDNGFGEDSLRLGSVSVLARD